MMKADVCQYCGGLETVRAKQVHEGKVIPENALLMISGETLHHVICKDCGTVIRSFVTSTDIFKED
ncbi:hypothetical protein ACYSNR_11565 [Enterococcus sp. LJL128]|uniref:hypothetical protein n=1 Tax=Enterococcus sp. LJL51 TaxID=3416656 RepID=UPI003CF629A8